MKLTALAAAMKPFLAKDADILQVQAAMSKAFAADKKGRDEGGLGPVENQNKAQDEKDLVDNAAMDAEAEYFGKAKDEWEKMSAKDRAECRDKARDEDPDMDAEDDVQPKESVSGGGKPAGNAGPTPAKDKAMDRKAVDALIRANDAKHRALREVEPILGVVTYDSAGDAYKAALTKMGVDLTDVPAAAYPSMFKFAKDRLASASATPSLAQDAEAESAMSELIPGYNRL